MALPSGARLGAYEVVAPLGAGGMGEVYRARDIRLNRDVAIKILPAVFTSDPDRLARFEREARVLATLNHPHIGAIYGVEESDGVRALVLELVEGDTLADRIARAPLPVAEALAVARQVAEALDAAHEKGIVHRDLKPANIKVTPEGVVKVLDFGLAKTEAVAEASLTHSPTVTAVNTRDGVLLGTASYMSPEQARGHVVDKRADIWAFGCVLFEMLTGRAPFARGTVTDTLAAIIEREPEWTLLPANTSGSVRHLLRRCLDKDPKRRLRDIGDARAELDDAGLRGDPPAEVRPGRLRRTWMLPALGIATAVALAAVFWPRTPADSGWQNPLANASFTRYTDFEGSELDAAISPDGRFVAFLSNRAGPFDAWLSQVGSGEFVNVSKGRLPALSYDDIRNIGFSPDGLIWLRQNRTDDFGKRVADGTLAQPLIGGDARLLLETGIEPVWSPDGSQLLHHDPAPGDPIFVSDRTGGNRRRIHVSEPGHHCHYLTWSRDARSVYFVGGIPPDEMDVWRVSAAGGTPERMTFHNGTVGYPTFVDDRTLLYRATSEDGSGPWLYALDVESRETRRVSLGVEQYLSVAAAADGRLLVATVSNPSSSLWTVPVSDQIVDERVAQRMPVPSVTAQSPRFGPDFVLYLSPKEGTRAPWRLRDGKATEVGLPADGGLLNPPAVSPDGAQLAVVVRVNGRNRLHLTNASGANARPIADMLDLREAPSWSPDGQWIAVAVADGLMKVPLDGSAPVRLVEGLVRVPVWSPDGRFILYSEALQGPGYTVKAVSPDGRPFPIPPLWVRRAGERYRILPDSRRVVYIRGDYGQQDFWMLDLVSGDRRQLTNLQPGSSIKGFDVSRDGTQIVFDRVRENSDVVLIELPPSSSSP